MSPRRSVCPQRRTQGSDELSRRDMPVSKNTLSGRPTMKLPRPITLVTLSCWVFTLAIFIAPREVSATNWQATAGAQSTDEGIQALAFLPNELWVHAGDSITWTFPTHEIHTVTFLM